MSKNNIKLATDGNRTRDLPALLRDALPEEWQITKEKSKIIEYAIATDGNRTRDLPALLRDALPEEWQITKEKSKIIEYAIATDGNRTRDLFLTMEALYLLSYSGVKKLTTQNNLKRESNPWPSRSTAGRSTCGATAATIGLMIDSKIKRNCNAGLKNLLDFVAIF
jgi:hypothetical protein